MESSDLSCNPRPRTDSENGNVRSDEIVELQEEVIANFEKPNVPNVNVPERIILCLDVCYDNISSCYRLGDGTTFTSFNMLKRILDFFIHSKHAINNETEFALLILKDTEACWMHDFTNNIRDLINTIDYIVPEESISETFDFKQVFELLERKAEIPQYKGDCILPPPYVVRMVVLFSRSNCIPQISQEDSYFTFLKKQLYFYIDILLAHEEDCSSYKCEEIYDTLQDLDNGYSYVFEVSKNATKIHDCIAKLLAHPFQRPLQKNANYTIATRI